MALHWNHVAYMKGDGRAGKRRHLMRSRCHGSSSCGRMSNIIPDWAQSRQVCRVQHALIWALGNVPGADRAHFQILHPTLLVSGFRRHGRSRYRQLCSAVMMTCVQGTAPPEMDSKQCARVHNRILHPTHVLSGLQGHIMHKKSLSFVDYTA